MTLSFQFGTVGSPLATPKKPGGSVGAIEFSKSLGLNTFELGWVQSVRVTEVTCAAIKAKAEEQNVSLSVHAPYFINLNALDDELKAKMGHSKLPLWRTQTGGPALCVVIRNGGEIPKIQKTILDKKEQFMLLS